jgi:hypothetical protein
MKAQRRLLAEVCREINGVADEWHRLVKRLDAGDDVRPSITDVEERLDRLYAEKRWLKAGGLVVSEELAGVVSAAEGRLRMSLHKYRYSAAYDMPTIEMQLEGP